MSKQQHTPGPWRITYGTKFLGVQNQGALGYLAQISLENDGGKEQALADARLIAAAPEMMECLKQCQKWFEIYAPVADTINGKIAELPMLTRVKKLIAKAEGEK